MSEVIKLDLTELKDPREDQTPRDKTIERLVSQCINLMGSLEVFIRDKKKYGDCVSDIWLDCKGCLDLISEIETQV